MHSLLTTLIYLRHDKPCEVQPAFTSPAQGPGCDGVTIHGIPWHTKPRATPCSGTQRALPFLRPAPARRDSRERVLCCANRRVGAPGCALRYTRFFGWWPPTANRPIVRQRARGEPHQHLRVCPLVEPLDETLDIANALQGTNRKRKKEIEKTKKGSIGSRWWRGKRSMTWGSRWGTAS